MSEISKNRRNFLKFTLIGGGSFLLGKTFGSFFPSFLSSSWADDIFGDFRVSENNRELIVYDDSGEPIFIIDKR